MIKKIKIKNFQCHEDLELNLSEGINIIAGASDRGKSSVLRAIDLVRENRPTGFSYRYDPRILKCSKKAIKETEITSVEITLNDGNKILRERNKKEVNQYRVNDEALKAMRFDVPEEVSSLLNIAPYSIQSQHNPYFLLNDSDGEVSRQINDLVGLEAIDKVQKKVNSIVSESKLKSEALALEIESKEIEIEKLKDLPKISKRIEELDENIKEAASIYRDIEEIEETIEEYSSISEELKLVKVHLQFEKSVDSIILNYDEFNTFNSLLSDLRKSTESLEEYNEKVDLYANLTALEGRISKLHEDTEHLSSVHSEIYDLQKNVATLTENSNLLYNVENEIKDFEEKYVSALKKAKVCPMCGSEINKC